MNFSAPTSIDELFTLYSTQGHRHYGEGVSADDHARQCAALAVADGATDELVLAALFHDVGWLLNDDGPNDEGVIFNHASWGARILSPLFGPAVAQPVALHVTAKRWRCTVDPNYFSELSSASRATFFIQGGLLRGDECARFVSHPGFAAALAVRSWDDRAKIPRVHEPGVESFRELAQVVAQRHTLSRKGDTSPARGARNE